MRDYANVLQRHPVRNALPVGRKLTGTIATVGSPMAELPR